MPDLLLVASPHSLATLNAVLNAVATVLLVVGLVMIKKKKEQAHKRLMLGAFGVSAAFLISYLTYHFVVGSEAKFAGEGAIAVVYFSILISHIVLAASVPVLTIMTIYYGLKNHRQKHRKIARWTFPIWLYVSITGVVIYLMLYHFYPSSA